MGQIVEMIDARMRQMLEQVHQDAFGWALYWSRGDREEAQELLQDVYARVLSQSARFDGRSSFKTWLFTVIRRTAQRRRWLAWRRLQRLQRNGPEVPEDSPQSPEQEVRLYRRELREQLEHILGKLSPRQQEVLRLVFYHGLTIEESAVIMNISVGSARTHYERGKARLAEILRDMGWQDEGKRNRSSSMGLL